MRECNDSNVLAMIAQLIWTIWALLSPVPRKAIKFNHSLTPHHTLWRKKVDKYTTTLCFIQYIAWIWHKYSLCGLHIHMYWVFLIWYPYALVSLYGINMPLFLYMVIQLIVLGMALLWTAIDSSLYPPHNEVVGGYIGFTSSIRPSVRPASCVCSVATTGLVGSISY